MLSTTPSQSLSSYQNTTAFHLPSLANAKSTVLVSLAHGGFWKSKCHAGRGGASARVAPGAKGAPDVRLGACRYAFTALTSRPHTVVTRHSTGMT